MTPLGRQSPAEPPHAMLHNSKATVHPNDGWLPVIYLIGDERHMLAPPSWRGTKQKRRMPGCNVCSGGTHASHLFTKSMLVTLRVIAGRKPAAQLFGGCGWPLFAAVP